MGFSSIQKTASTGSSATGALVGVNSLQPWASTFRTVQFLNSVIYLLHICIVFHILSVFVILYTGNWKEKWPLVFTPGKGLKIDLFEFSTHSLSLPISNPNPEGSIFRPSPVLSTFVPLFLSSRFITFHRFSSISSLLLCEVIQHMLYKQ
jgi:hypothetical protein